jgi:hypothetical protein
MLYIHSDRPDAKVRLPESLKHLCTSAAAASSQTWDALTKQDRWTDQSWQHLAATDRPYSGRPPAGTRARPDRPATGHRIRAAQAAERSRS